jgi:hypothetical protein
VPNKTVSTVDEAIAELIHSASTSPWLKGVLENVLAEGRDPELAARDATLLAAVMVARARVICGSDIRSPSHSEGVDLWLPLVDGEPVAARVSGKATVVDLHAHRASTAG